MRSHTDDTQSHLTQGEVLHSKMNHYPQRIIRLCLFWGLLWITLGTLISCGGLYPQHTLLRHIKPPPHTLHMNHLQATSEMPQHDQYSAIKESQYHDPKIEPLSTFSIDVDTASYANVRRFITGGDLPPVDAVRIEEMINYFTYKYDEPDASAPHPFSVNTELASAPWNPKHQLLHIGLQGRHIPRDQLPPSNLVRGGTRKAS